MRRKDPIYVTTVVGKPVLEDAYIGKVIERSFLPLIDAIHQIGYQVEERDNFYNPVTVS